MFLGVLGAGTAEGRASPWGQWQAGFFPGLVEEALHVVTHISAYTPLGQCDGNSYVCRLSMSENTLHASSQCSVQLATLVTSFQAAATAPCNMGCAAYRQAEPDGAPRVAVHVQKRHCCKTCTTSCIHSTNREYTTLESSGIYSKGQLLWNKDYHPGSFFGPQPMSR